MDLNKKQKVSIATGSIFKIALVAVGIWFLYELRDIIGLVFVAIFFAAAIRPIVSWFAKKKIPRPLAMIIIYAVVLLIIALVVGFLVPPISHQLNDIAGRFPKYYNQAKEELTKIQSESGAINIGNLIGQFSGVAGKGLLSILSGIFGGVIFFVVVLVIIFYMAVQKDAIDKIVKSIVPLKYEKDITCLLYRIQNKLGYWLRSVLLLGAIIAILTFLFLLPVMPKYALTLALFAGLTEFIPYVGPFLGAIPAVFLAFAVGSWSFVIYVVIIYIIIQQAEVNFIVPQVMKRSVGLNPIVSIIAVMIGARLGQFLGISAIVGILLAIPVAITVFEIIDYYADKKRGRKECGI